MFTNGWFFLPHVEFHRRNSERTVLRKPSIVNLRDYLPAKWDWDCLGLLNVWKIACSVGGSREQISTQLFGKGFPQSEVLGEVCILEGGSSGRSFRRSLGRSFWRSFRACFAWTFRAINRSAKTSAQNSHGSAQQNLRKHREKRHDENLQGGPANNSRSYDVRQWEDGFACHVPCKLACFDPSKLAQDFRSCFEEQSTPGNLQHATTMLVVFLFLLAIVSLER